MAEKDLTFKEKEIDAQEFTQMIEKLTWEKKKTIHDMIKGYELLSMAEKNAKETA